jgi:hypothetical protein
LIFNFGETMSIALRCHFGRLVAYVHSTRTPRLPRS